MTPARADALVALGQIALHAGEPRVAIERLQRAYDYWQTLNPNSRWASEAMLWLGRSHVALGDEAAGRKMIDTAVEQLRQSRFPIDQQLVWRQLRT